MILLLLRICDWVVRLLTYVADVLLSDSVDEYSSIRFDSIFFKSKANFSLEELIQSNNDRYEKRWMNFMIENLNIDFSKVSTVLCIYSIFDQPSSRKRIEFYLNNNLWGFLNYEAVDVLTSDEYLLKPSLEVYLIHIEHNIYRIFTVVAGKEIKMVKDFGCKKLNKVWLTQRFLVYNK